jgi:alpha-tubulin suppressor-like RCC1 family protein
MTTVFVGSFCSFFIINDKLYSVGKNRFYQLGHNNNISHKTPKRVDISEDILNLDINHTHTLMINKQNQLYGLGDNSHNQLGIKLRETITKPIKILDNVKMGKCGNNFSVIIRGDGKAFSFGDNHFGQLGLGHNFNVIEPTLISNLTGIASKVTCGESHTLLLIDSQVFSFGRNGNGQLGHSQGKDSSVPIKIDIDEKVIDIDCGSHHSGIVTEGGKVYMFGFNDFGQLGLGDELSKRKPELLEVDNIKKIFCGTYHTILLSLNNTLFSFGRGKWGLLGHGDGLKKLVPTPIAFFNGKVISNVACGDNHNLIVDSNNVIYGFGKNDWGQLTRIDPKDYLEPIIITIGLTGGSKMDLYLRKIIKYKKLIS